MATIITTTFYNYGVEKDSYTVEDPDEWVQQNYPDAEKIDEYFYRDYESDTDIEII